MNEIFSCKKCNAPINVTPESIVTVCPYCGYPNIISGIISPEDVYIIPSHNKAKIIDRFNMLIRTDFDLRKLAPYIQVYDIRAFYAPVWMGDIRVNGMVSYYKIVRENKTTRRKYYTSNVDRTLTVFLPARRQPMKFGIDEAINRFKSTSPNIVRLVDIDRYQWENMKLEILNTEFDKSEAYRRIKEESLDIVREEYKRRSDGIDAFLCKSGEPTNLKLVLLPIWWIYYKYKDSIYYIVFSGWDLYPIIRTEPVTTFRRLIYLIGSLFFLLATPISIIIVSSAEEKSLGSYVIPLLLMAGSCYMTSLALRSVRIEK